MAKDNFSYEIVECIAVLSENPDTLWQKRLQRVSWNRRFPKYDIREWSPDPDPKTGQLKMSRGITLTDAEMEVIRDAVLQGRL